MVLSWTIGTSPYANLVNTMLDRGINRLTTGLVPIIHSDRGAHYRWPGWLERTTRAGHHPIDVEKGVHP
jgi:putative transposase